MREHRVSAQHVGAGVEAVLGAGRERTTDRGPHGVYLAAYRHAELALERHAADAARAIAGRELTVDDLQPKALRQRQRLFVRDLGVAKPVGVGRATRAALLAMAVADAVGARHAGGVAPPGSRASGGLSSEAMDVGVRADGAASQERAHHEHVTARAHGDACRGVRGRGAPTPRPDHGALAVVGANVEVAFPSAAGPTHVSVPP